jgi:UDP-N-acetylmuramoyl-L-alanyl-D-glutamate--2,6-diaminopimelate ligase
MKLEQIVREVHPLKVEGPLDREITGITCDSRRVLPGNLFVAVRGVRTDGHGFVDAAIDRGAIAVLCEREISLSPRATRIRVEDSRRSLGIAAAAFYRHPSQQLRVIGVTGTNGKTTTTFLSKHILESSGIATGLIGTVQYEIGGRIIPAARTTPESLEIQSMMKQMLDADCGAVTMEVSSHALAQHRVEGVDFDVAVFTNLSVEHLDYHGTMDEYFGAKRKLFARLGAILKDGQAVLNLDDAYGQKLAKFVGNRRAIYTYAIENDAAVMATDIRLQENRTRFTLLTTAWGAHQDVVLPLLGRHNVYNALAATSAALALGMDLDTICGALATFSGVPGRLQSIEVGQPFRVFVDYAHTNDALRNALLAIREIARGRVLVVFGCGGDRDRTKRPLMGRVASELADFVFLTSDNPRTEEPLEIIREIESGIEAPHRYQVIVDRREAIERALDIARPGDAVLVAGKGHETYQEFADVVVPFDDRQVILDYFNEVPRGWASCA